MAGLKYWETCVCFCFSYFPCGCCLARPRGRVYDRKSATKKSTLESTLALRTPRYNVPPGNTDNTLIPGKNKLYYYIDTSVLLENIPLVKFIKTTSGPEWFIFHNLTREFIDDVISVISLYYFIDVFLSI